MSLRDKNGKMVFPEDKLRTKPKRGKKSATGGIVRTGRKANGAKQRQWREPTPGERVDG
jgi:hypothetical protein